MFRNLYRRMGLAEKLWPSSSDHGLGLPSPTFVSRKGNIIIERKVWVKLPEANLRLHPSDRLLAVYRTAGRTPSFSYHSSSCIRFPPGRSNKSDQVEAL